MALDLSQLPFRFFNYLCAQDEIEEDIALAYKIKEEGREDMRILAPETSISGRDK